MKGLAATLALTTGILAIYLPMTTAAINNEPKKVHFEPQITTICPTTPTLPPSTLDPVNNYMTPEGTWALDPTSTKCMRSKVEILKFCQRMYPGKDINNIVESTHMTQVDVCIGTASGGKCKGEMGVKWVKPWRCLESPFQSDALLVPAPCLFDHIHNSTLCASSEEWNSTAVKSCVSKQMYLKSYAVLLPCGISLFTGVEFVCCPEDKKIDYNSEDYEDEDEDEDEDEEEDEEYEFDRSTSTTTTTTPKPTQDPYFQTFNVLNEHQNYIEAKERLVKAHKTRINSIMSDWNKLEERYQAMRGNDPGGAEEFKRAVTMRFQKTVKALEEESLAEKKQLISIHGQRILSHLNEKKRESMECFTKSLNERPQVSRRIRKCMEKLMKYLNKDRHHTVLYFKNNPGNQDIMEYTLDRLEQIGATVKEAFIMLGRYPHLSAELKPLVEDYILSLQGMDGLKFNILTATREVDSVLLNSLIGKTTVTQQQPTTEQTTQPPATQQPTTTTTQQPTTEEEEEPKYYRANDYVANLAKRDELHREATFTVRREVYYANDSKNVYLIMAFAGFALFGTLVIGMVVLRRRNSPRNQGFLEVNTLASGAPCGEDIKSPEEKHVVNMQINGYENPTYKYFEVGTIIK